MKTVSILIPSHNRCRILARTLESLSKIRIPDQVDLEVIVVANACTDDTELVVAAAAAKMPMPTRCVVEEVPGLNNARNRAATEAKGDVFAYLDDDVWVEPDWLIGLIEVYDSQLADIVGGRVLLWWDAVTPPSWMSKNLENMLSGSDHGENVFEVGSTGKFCMLGANFSFTRQTFQQVGAFRLGLDRKGKSLLSGGESEFLMRARAKGLRMFYAPRACVKHWVAPHRITLKYLQRLAFDFGRTSVFLAAPKPRLQWWLAAVGQPFRAFVSFGGELLAHLSGKQSTAIERRLGGIRRIGIAAGAIQRIIGTAPSLEVAPRQADPDV